MPRQASLVRWAGIGAMAGALLYVIYPLESGNVFASVTAGLIGGGLFGAAAAALRNWFAGPR